MLRIILVCTLFAFSAALAQTPPPGIKPPPPGAPPPRDPTLGPDPKPKAKPVPPRPGELAQLVASYPPPNAPAPDPKVPANPKSAALLRGIIAGLEKDTVDHGLFGPDMVLSLKANGAALMAFVQAHGPMMSLTYRGALEPINPLVVDGKPRQVEEFESVHENGTLRWRFHLAPDGKVARLVAMSGAE